MNREIFEQTSKAAYFLWDYTANENALNIWYCAEDIASYFERLNIIDHMNLNELLSLDKTNIKYINFVRNIAFRIFVYTNDKDHIKNWFVSEQLLKNNEWTNAILTISKYYNKHKNDLNIKQNIKSDYIKSYYLDCNNTNHVL